jgi:ABC-type branched-subunit amino acid transport system substrate-binding protein
MAGSIVRTGVLALALTVSALAPTLADDIIRFGAAVSLTGSLSTEAKQMKDGYDFYVKQINERGGNSHRRQEIQGRHCLL